MDRALTPCERQLAHSVYGDALDLDAVRIAHRKWWPFQPSDTVMAPCGTICFHPKDGRFTDDFCNSDLWTQGLLIHELMHTLQTQQRGKYYLPLMRHPFCQYSYSFVPGQPFHRYGLEQQAEIARHVFLMRKGQILIKAPALADLEAILPF